MMLTVSMTVSHLCQNLEIIKGVRSLSKGVNYCDKLAKSLCRHPLSWFGGGDHLYPYERKLIGSLVPVHSKSDCDLIHIVFDLIHMLSLILLTKMADSNRNCQHH